MAGSCLIRRVSWCVRCAAREASRFPRTALGTRDPRNADALLGIRFAQRSTETFCLDAESLTGETTELAPRNRVRSALAQSRPCSRATVRILALLHVAS